MESFYAILGGFVLLIDVFFGFHHAKHAYSDVNLFFCCTYFVQVLKYI